MMMIWFVVSVCVLAAITTLPNFTKLVERVKHAPGTNLLNFGADLFNIAKNSIFLHEIWWAVYRYMSTG